MRRLSPPHLVPVVPVGMVPLVALSVPRSTARRTVKVRLVVVLVLVQPRLMPEKVRPGSTRLVQAVVAVLH